MKKVFKAVLRSMTMMYCANAWDARTGVRCC